MKLKFVSNDNEHIVYVPNLDVDLFQLSRVFESKGFLMRIVTPELGVFDLDGSEIHIMKNGHVVIKDTNTENAKEKAMKVITLMSQSLGRDLILEY